MKKILCTLLLITFTISGYSQEHFEFMGIPIDGSVDAFAKRLKDKGFKESSSKDKYFLEGKFATEDVYVQIVKTPKTQTVCAVLIHYYQVQNNWNLIKLKFDNLVRQFSIKHNNPEDLTKSFQEPFKEGDGNEINALKADKVKFLAEWSMENGGISITLISTGTPMVSYTDKANFSLYLQEEQELALDDI